MNESAREYLVSHGKIGGVGRFAVAEPVALARGTRVVVESPRGLEAGDVLCQATQRHVALMAVTVVGRIVRVLDADDEARLENLQERCRLLFEDACRLRDELDLPLEILDVDVMLDGSQVILQHLLAEPCDLTAFVERLQQKHHFVVLLEDLTVPHEREEEHHHEGGCGDPNCGRKDGGGCTSCGTGGCSSCGSGKVDMAAYFGHLRTKMEETKRVPLL